MIGGTRHESMTLEQITDQLEKRLVCLPKTADCSNPYLAGYIDCLWDTGFLSPSDRARLYFQYANPEVAKILAKKLL